MKLSALALISMLVACAHSALADSSAPAPTWHDSSEYDSSSVREENYPAKKIRCGHTLYPSHPQQSLKQYHLNQWADYDTNKVDANDRLCLVKTNRSSGKQSCLRSDYSVRIIISDVFVDACGEFYRGFEEVNFFNQDENMGTLYSPGRTMYPNRKSDYAKDMAAGGTYSVPESRFIKVGPPLPGDIEKSEQLKTEAISEGMRLDPTSHLFLEQQ